MNQTLVGNILGMSSIKIANLVSICVQTWLPRAIFVFDWLISKKNFSPETTFPNELKLYMQHLWDSFYKDW